MNRRAARGSPKHSAFLLYQLPSMKPFSLSERDECRSLRSALDLLGRASVRQILQHVALRRGELMRDTSPNRYWTPTIRSKIVSRLFRRPEICPAEVFLLIISISCKSFTRYAASKNSLWEPTEYAGQQAIEMKCKAYARTSVLSEAKDLS